MQYTSPRRDCDLTSFFLHHVDVLVILAFQHRQGSCSKACRKRHLGRFVLCVEALPLYEGVLGLLFVVFLVHSTEIRLLRLLASRTERIPKTTCRSCPGKARPYKPAGHDLHTGTNMTRVPQRRHGQEHFAESRVETLNSATSRSCQEIQKRLLWSYDKLLH